MEQNLNIPIESPQLNELASALSKAQSEISPAAKDSENPHFRSKYADLAAVWEACRAPLSKHGLSVVQSTLPGPEQRPILMTTLLHTSGQFMRSFYPLKPVKEDPQGYGSALTYARRYCLAAIVGVVADEDDDGNGASGAKPPQGQRSAAKKPQGDTPPPPNPLAKPTTPGEYVPVGGRFKGKRLDSVPVADLLKYVAEIRASGEKLKAGALEMVEAMQRHIDCEGMKEAKQDLEPEWAQEGARIPAGGAS